MAAMGLFKSDIVQQNSLSKLWPEGRSSGIITRKKRLGPNPLLRPMECNRDTFAWAAHDFCFMILRVPISTILDTVVLLEQSYH